MKIYADFQNLERTCHFHYMKAYQIEEKLKVIHRLNDEIQEICNEDIPKEIPPNSFL